MAPCGQCPTCIQVEAGAHPDLYQIQKPDERTQIPIELFIGPRERRLQEGLCAWMALKPLDRSRKIAIVDDADTIGLEAANSILKTLEEPPPRSVMILIGTNPTAQLPTIRSRCQTIHFSGLDDETMRDLIQSQGIAADTDHVEFLTRLAGGSLSRASELADPSIREFRQSWYEWLADANTDPVFMARETNKFVEQAGTLAGAKRDRLRLVIDLTVDLFRRALRLAVEAGEADEFWVAAKKLTVSWNQEVASLGACVFRCSAARQHVDAMANLPNVLDSLLADFEKIRRHGPDAILDYAGSGL
jgi:DNA polymerase-3 subunit delta'